MRQHCGASGRPILDVELADIGPWEQHGINTASHGGSIALVVLGLLRRDAGLRQGGFENIVQFCGQLFVQDGFGERQSVRLARRSLDGAAFEKTEHGASSSSCRELEDCVVGGSERPCNQLVANAILMVWKWDFDFAK